MERAEHVAAIHAAIRKMDTEHARYTEAVTARNNAIAAALRDGMSIAEVSREIGLSANAVMRARDAVDPSAGRKR